MIKASIDIGTNTVLLLVAEVGRNSLQVLREEQRIPRLGQGVDDSGQLSDAAMQRVIAAVKEYQSLMDSQFDADIPLRLTATSAVRDAQNRQQFSDRIKEETGFDLEIVSGMEEAQLTFAGAKSMVRDQPDTQDVIIDIGGGSTEVAIGEGAQIFDRYSFDMGCVRYTERFLAHDPPTSDELRRCCSAIREMLQTYKFKLAKQVRLIGVAGTVTSLAYIDLGLTEYNSELLSGHHLTAEVISAHIEAIQQQTARELQAEHPVVMEGRADIFLAGLLILREFMTFYDFDHLVTSTGGIRHGAIL
ncbi:MAG: Ppx/GppA phosphatase family protein [Fodinibius sp.]|nr:Ppx/GppA phosphatase family protein [Fodinibius sp.]